MRSPTRKTFAANQTLPYAAMTPMRIESQICQVGGGSVDRERPFEPGTVNLWEVPGYRIELTPFGGIKDSGLGYKEGVQEAIKSFTNLKSITMPWG